MVSRLLYRLVLFVTRNLRWLKPALLGLLVVIVVVPTLGIIAAKIYQNMDDDADRGAIAINQGVFGESFAVPEYLDQGWDEAGSLWFYNTTQGSALLPYDFLLVLEQSSLKHKTECDRNGRTAAWILCDENVDRLRYLPQKATLFNPDALPVGFVKETYQGKDYVGYTCAACHTGQMNYTNPGEQTARALRIDGGPAMADMVTFLTELERSLKLTRGLPNGTNPRLDRFVEDVLALNNDYETRAEVEQDLEKWADVIILYNVVNHSTKNGQDVEYGYARLDAFGRIYNRVIQHAINRDQVATELALATVDGKKTSDRLLSDSQIRRILYGAGEPGDAVGAFILRDGDFAKIVTRLRSDEPGYPNLNDAQINIVRDEIFNPPNAPVSYPFLWDTTHSDYVQWNGLASNAAAGPIGRNAGEVTGVFGILDWQEDRRWTTRLTGFSLSALLSGQDKKKKQIYFKSSIDLFNLQRLESHLSTLVSPRWPFCKSAPTGEYYLPSGPKKTPVDLRECEPGDDRFDKASKDRGQVIFARLCQECHDHIDPRAYDRVMVSHMSSLPKAGTDKAMARNSVHYAGKSGNFEGTYQTVGVGKLVARADAPVAVVLTAATKGVVATPDADKWWPRRFVEYVYALALTIFENPVQASIKQGNYLPDTTARPLNSLLSYRARSLNGIWATAPYLHNGSVPNLWDLLLPVKRAGDVEGGRCQTYRPDSFVVGSRVFDPVNVGFRSEGYDGFVFDTQIPGNANTGHEYGACKMTDQERWDLIEYLRSL